MKKKDIPHVLVLGCGPAGLFAAEAVRQAGARVSIVSKKRKSEMFGAQYLHEPIPNLSDPGDFISVLYELSGTADGYRQKVYGDRPVEVSPETLQGRHAAWDIRRAYDVAWDRFGPYVVDSGPIPAGTAFRVMLKEVEDLHRIKYDLIINSLPAPVLCLDPEHHVFKAEQVWAIGDAPERGVRCPVRVAASTVLCNGEDAPAWYRAANVFGHCTVEWPAAKKPPLEYVGSVQKPVETTCDCWPEMLRVGRYGRWTKGVLSHEAFSAAASAMTAL